MDSHRLNIYIKKKKKKIVEIELSQKNIIMLFLRKLPYVQFNCLYTKHFILTFNVIVMYQLTEFCIVYSITF